MRGMLSRASAVLRCADGRAALIGIVALGVAVRLIGILSAKDIFVDEAIYARIGRSVASGGIVPSLFGSDFYTAPPLFMWILGAVTRIIGPQSDLAHLVLALRGVNVVFATVSISLVFGIGRRLGGVRAGVGAGLLAALLFAVEPFLVQFDGIVMIETSATMFALAGWWALLRGMDDHGKVSARASVLSGLLFGLALMTKETTFFLFAPALILVLVSGRLMARRRAGLVLGAAVIPYVGVLAALISTDSWTNFYDQKLMNLQRLLGAIRITGFKAPGAPSFVEKTIDNIPRYGATYLLMCVGAVAVVYLLRRGGTARRLFALGVGGEILMTAYNLTIGGLVEEQHFYLFVAPACVVVALMVVDALSSGRRALVGAATVGLIVLLIFDTACVVGNRTITDNSYIDLDAYVTLHYGPRAVVMSTESAYEMLSEAPFLVEKGVPLTTQSHTSGSRLVLTSTRQIDEGYASVGPAIYDELRSDGAKVVWSQTGYSNGTLELWELPATG